MSHSHELVDGDIRFVIDPATREITPKNHVKTKLMQGDHASEIFTFEMPQFIEGHDMSQCDDIEIHFINLGAKGEEYGGINHIENSSIEDNKFVFTWVINGGNTRFEGTLSFSIKFKCYSEDGEDSGRPIYVWNTDIFSNVKIAKTYDFTPN